MKPLHSSAPVRRALAVCGLACALAAQVTEEAKKPPASVLPLSIRYAPDGLQLTPAMVQGLLNGPVLREVNRVRRERNPDWPDLGQLAVSQAEADLRQPGGAFTCVVELPAGGVRDHLRDALVESLQHELDRRLCAGPRDRLERELTQARAKLELAEAELRGVRHKRANVPEARGNEEVDRIVAQISEVELRLSVEGPVHEVEEKHILDLRRHAAEVNQRIAELASEVTTLESRAQGRTDAAQQAALRLAQLQSQREELARDAEQVSERIAQTTSAMQDRTTDLAANRRQQEVLRARLAQAMKQSDEARAHERDRMALDEQVDILRQHVESIRARCEELRGQAEDLVPVLVEVWG
jgi:hypothetical protein